MVAFINATGFASLLTALFAMRFRFWGSPLILVAYFAVFFGLEIAVSLWVLPPDAFGPEIGILCLCLTVVVSAAVYGLRRYERGLTGQADGGAQTQNPEA